MNSKRGQSIIEAVFLIGSLGIVLTGAAVLFINSINVRTKSFDRNKAVTISGQVVEGLVNLKNNDPATFWSKTTQIGQTLAEYPDYKYNVNYTNFGSCPVANCTEVVVSVMLVQDVGKSMVFTRSFTR